MTEEMQINEIAREICHLYDECETCQICNEKYPIDDGELCYFQCIAKEIISHDYRKVKRGEWRFIGNANGGSVGGGTLYYKCTVCNHIAHPSEVEWWNFCPDCGADMRGKKNA